VIFHGIGETGVEDFFPVLAGLSHGRRVISFDLPGFGRSAYHSDDLGPDRMIAAMGAVIHACDLDRVDMLGHSSGALLALLFASQSPERIRRLILAAPVGILRPEVLLHAQISMQLEQIHEDTPRVANAVQSVGDFVVHILRLLTPSSEALADSGLIGRSPTVLLATALLDYNFGVAISRIHVPTLILEGAQDKVVPPRIGRLLEDRIDTARVEYVRDAGHVIMRDQSAPFVASVSRFLTGPASPREEHRAPPAARGTEVICHQQSHMVIRGAYDRVVLEDCHHAWLDHVTAGQVVMRDSEARLDDVHVEAGVQAERSLLMFTAGEVRGAVALDLSDSKVDAAGTSFEGREAAILARETSRVVLSVSPVESPLSRCIMHQSLELAPGEKR